MSAFTQWLRDDTAQVRVLAELQFGYQSAGVPAVGTIYLANMGYITWPSDTPANQRYRGVIEGLSFTRSVNVTGGATSLTVQDMTLANSDSGLDFMRTLIVDGRNADFYIGDETWARADFRLALRASIELVEGTLDTVVVKLRDRRVLLDRDVRGDVMGGSGPNATKFLPLIWGFVENIDLTPYLYDSTTLEFSVLSNYETGSTPGLADLRDNGLSLRSPYVTWTSGDTTANAATDTLSHVAHGLNVNDVVWFTDIVTPVYSQTRLFRPFAHSGSATQLWVKTVPTADTFTLSLTRGGATLDITGTSWDPDNAGQPLKMVRQRWFDNTWTNGRIQLSSSPAGRLTADVLNLARIPGPDGPWFWDSSLPFDFAGGLMYGYGRVSSSDLDEPTFAAADAALDAKVAMGLLSLYLPNRMNLLSLLNGWLGNIFGFYGANHIGKLHVGIVSASGLASATAVDAISWKETTEALSVRNLQVTTKSASVQYQLNHTPQDSISAAATDAARTKYSATFAKQQDSTAPSGTAYATNKPAYHLAMTASAPVQIDIEENWPSLGGGPFPIGPYADAIVADAAPHLCVATVTVDNLSHYARNLGDVVTLTYPRYGFDNGVNCRVIAVTVDLIAERMEFQLLTQITPDYLTGAHP